MSKTLRAFLPLAASAALLFCGMSARAGVADGSFHLGFPPACPGEDPAYSFTFTLGSNFATGHLVADANLVATSGSITITGDQFGPGYAGTYNLLPVPAGVDANYYAGWLSPSGAFAYDDKVAPAGPSDVDWYGLMFKGSNGEINIWVADSSHPNDYSIGLWNADRGLNQYAPGTLEMHLNPEASSLLLILPGLVPVGMLIRRRRA